MFDFDWDSLFLIVVLCIALYVLFDWLWSFPEGTPPGPIGLPVLGYLPFLGRKMNVTLTNLSKEFGDVFQIRIGSRRLVIVNGQRAIRAAVQNHGTDFAGRPTFFTYKNFGVFGAPGYTQTFKLYKKLTVRSITMFSTERKQELQQVAYDAVDMLLTQFKEAKNEPLDPKPTLYRVVWTIMGYMCYGTHFDIDSPEVERVFNNVDSFGKLMMFGVLIDYFPWAHLILRKQLDKLDTVMTTLDKYSDELTNKNLETYDPNNLRNICDMFKKAGDAMSAEEKSLLNVTDETLKGVVTGVFGAGFGTIAVTTKWAILLMAKYPEVQLKVQQEIDNLLGSELPTFDDQSRLKYATAVIAEIYRYSSMSSLGITHATTRLTTLDGFLIPKDTPVVFNLFSAHRDTKVFTDPEEFNPSRFLMENGDLNTDLMDNVIPYGIGARRCGGELISRLEIFLFFVVIMQRSKIVEVPGHPLDPTNYIFGLGIDPVPFKVSFQSRKGEW